MHFITANLGLLRAPRMTVFLGLLILAVSLNAFAKDDSKKPDVRLIIDVSGSMKKNDPNNLRQPAVELLVRLLPDGSKAGVWTFGKYVNMLIPHQVVNEAWRDMARTNAKEINSLGLFTNIGGALEKAAHDTQRPNDNFNTSVILLTDGMVDVSKSPEDNQKEWRRIVDKVLPELKNADFTIHTVALSENADTSLLEKMAVSTDGTSAIAYNAEDLMKIFLKAFDVAAPSQQVPLEGNTFAVDSSVEEFTALIFRVNSAEEAQLIGPDKEIYTPRTRSDDVNWLRTERYDLITVKRPVEGEWLIKADIDPDSRITIVSDMKLRVKALPNNGFKGAKETLSFVLQEDGKTITRADFLALLNNTVSIDYGPQDTPVSQIWNYAFDRKVMPATGVFTVALPELKRLGVYDLAVLVDGKTFKRTFNHRITVREPFSASIDQKLDANGIEQYIISVRSHGDDIDVKQTQVAATITSPSRRNIVKPLVFTEFDRWQTLINPDMVGEYKIKVQVTGKTSNDEPFVYSLEPLSLQYNPTDVFSDTPEAVIAPVEPVPEPMLPEETPSPAEPTQPVEVKTPEPTPEPLLEEPSVGFLQSLPSWLMYVALALGNLLILGGGYFLFKKLSSASSEDSLDDLNDDTLTSPPPLAPFEDGEQAPETMKMDAADDDEVPPPMEDLEGASDFDSDDFEDEDDEMDMAKAMAMEAEFKEDPPVIADEVDVDDFGVDDIEEDSDDLLSEDDNRDLEEEMLKAQGLDLADDELDDAISSLIDDLDGSRESGDDSDDLDGIDFEDDDDDEALK